MNHAWSAEQEGDKVLLFASFSLPALHFQDALRPQEVVKLAGLLAVPRGQLLQQVPVEIQLRDLRLYIIGIHAPSHEAYAFLASDN